MLLATIQNANLVTFTFTPMGAFSDIWKLLERLSSGKVYLLLPVGFPANDATVPYRNPERKPMDNKVLSINYSIEGIVNSICFMPVPVPVAISNCSRPRST
jgi:iodotyrosine deiodinase